MGSASTVNSGLASLIQTLSANAPGAVASVLATPSVQAALEKAPTGDLVKLSNQALQLQETGLLFGDGASTDFSGETSSSSTPDSLFSILSSSLASQATSQASSSSSTSDSSSAQSQELAALLGTNSTSTTANPLFNLYG